MLEDVSVLLPLRTGLGGGDLSGEEKMPSKFSMPYSSRSFSFSVMPVFLEPCQHNSVSATVEGYCVPSLNTNIEELVLSQLLLSPRS